jgi:hypothetical protein
VTETAEETTTIIEQETPYGVIKRAPDGKFLPGTTGGPGRLPLAKEHEYLDILRTQVSSEQWCSVVQKAVSQAIDGNWRARQWLSKYLLPPIATIQAHLVEHRDITELDDRILQSINILQSIGILPQPEDTIEGELADE